MSHLLLIAAGGALGALLRYAVSGLVHALLGAAFPWGTLAVNGLGCLVIGLLGGLAERSPLPPGVAPFVIVGVLGAFTTFSTFGIETFALLRSGQVGPGLVNLAATNALGLAAVATGFAAARLGS